MSCRACFWPRRFIILLNNVGWQNWCGPHKAICLLCSLMMPSIIVLLFIVLLQSHSWASPGPDESTDVFDLDPESIFKESLDPDVSLNSISFFQPESDLNSYENSVQTNDLIAFDDSGLGAGANNDCPVNNGQSRKRNGVTCPASGPIEPPPLGIFGDHNDEELDSVVKVGSDERNENTCSEILFFFGRIYDLCCDGPFGPFVIDLDVRLIYSWISNCRRGMSKPYVIALICVPTHRSDNSLICRQFYSLSNSDQCLLSISCRELIVHKFIFSPSCPNVTRHEANFFVPQAK